MGVKPKEFSWRVLGQPILSRTWSFLLGWGNPYLLPSTSPWQLSARFPGTTCTHRSSSCCLNGSHMLLTAVIWIKLIGFQFWVDMIRDHLNLTETKVSSTKPMRSYLPCPV